MTFSDISTILYDALVYITLAFVIFLLGKLAYQLTNKSIKVNEELVKKDNLAFGFAHVGYFIGLLLAIGSAIVGPSNGLLIDVIDISVYGILAIILLNLSVYLTDKVLLRKFSVRKEIIEDQNSGTGIVQGAVSVASGLIIMGAVSGEGVEGLVGGIVSAILFWLIGQLALLLVSWVYNIITPYDIHEHLERDNVAVGIGYAGALIAVANLIRFGLSGDFESWAITLSGTGFEIIIGLILLPVMRYLSDKVLLPGERLTDEIINQEKPNLAAALVEAFSYIGGSVLITWCL